MTTARDRDLELQRDPDVEVQTEPPGGWPPGTGPAIPVDRIEVAEIRPTDHVVVHLDGRDVPDREAVARAKLDIAGALGVDPTNVLFLADGVRLELYRPVHELRDAKLLDMPEREGAWCRHCGQIISRALGNEPGAWVTGLADGGDDYCPQNQPTVTGGVAHGDGGHVPREDLQC